MTDTLRESYIAGLRELADFMEAHPDLPATTDHCVLGDDDTAGRAEIERVAAILGVEAKLVHEHSWECNRRFGRVTYRAFYVLRQRMSEYHEAGTYRDNFRRPLGAVTR